MPKLEPFDPSRPLKANTFFRLHGTIYKRGDAVPYDEADRRNIERLYSLRRIGYGDGEPVERKTPRQAFMETGAALRTQERQAKRRAKEEQAEKALEAEVGGDEAEAAKKLAKAHTHDQLFKMASGLAGVTKSQKKDEIALALVRAGRGDS